MAATGRKFDASFKAVIALIVVVTVIGIVRTYRRGSDVSEPVQAQQITTPRPTKPAMRQYGTFTVNRITGSPRIRPADYGYTGCIVAPVAAVTWKEYVDGVHTRTFGEDGKIVVHNEVDTLVIRFKELHYEIVSDRYENVKMAYWLHKGFFPEDWFELARNAD